MVRLTAKQKQRLADYLQRELDESLGRYVREAAEKGELDAIGFELEWWNRRIVAGAPAPNFAKEPSA